MAKVAWGDTEPTHAMRRAGVGADRYPQRLARMRLDRVQPGDVIKAAIKGRTGIWGEVTEVKDGTVYFLPLCPATGWRHASAHEVVGHWRKARRRGTAGDEDALPVPTEQLSLPGVHT